MNAKSRSTRIAMALGALALSITGLVATAPAASAAVAADFTSIFAGQQADMTTSGWEACAAPVTWSLDTRGLTAKQARTATTQLTKAFETWGVASGLSFQFTGSTAITFDAASVQPKLANGGALQARHIYIGIASNKGSAYLSATHPGFGAPTAVATDTKDITGGYAFFSREYLTSLKGSTANAKSLNLYLHEIGHVLGLGHASSTTNVMNAVVTTRSSLGSGDVTGVRTLTKPCVA